MTKTLTVDEHLKAIEEWAAEAMAENPELQDIDVWGDIVPSYIAYHIGSEDRPMAKEIRRRLGRDL